MGTTGSRVAWASMRDVNPADGEPTLAPDHRAAAPDRGSAAPARRPATRRARPAPASGVEPDSASGPAPEPQPEREPTPRARRAKAPATSRPPRARRPVAPDASTTPATPPDGVPSDVDLVARAAALRAADRIADARAAHADQLAAFDLRAHGPARSAVLAEAAETELLAGNLGAAGRLIDEALAALAGSDAGGSAAAIHRARLDLLTGRVTQGSAVAAAGVTAAEGLGDSATAAAWLGVLGLAELLAGDPSVAAVHFTTVRDSALERGMREPWHTRVEADLVEALVAAGRLDEAEAALDSLRSRGAIARTPWVIAVDARSEALLRTARGEPEAALGALRAAAATIESLPLLLERSRCLLAWGVALRATGRFNAAPAALTTAREGFAALPSPPWEARAVAEMTRLRRRPATD